MHTKKRKIAYYYLKLSGGAGLFEIGYQLDYIIDYILSLDRKERMYNLNSSKFCLLQESSKVADTRKVIFESAKHSYRSDLMNRNNADKRKNPKKMIEGEVMKTHSIIRSRGDEVVMMSEITQSGIKINQFIQYLNYFKSKYEEEKHAQLNYNFSYDIIVKHNFQEELQKMSRVSSTIIHIDKGVLGSEFLDYSNRPQNVQEEITVEIKSKPRENIIHAAVDVVQHFLAGTRSEIRKITIQGKNEDNNDMKMDTSFIEKQEWVEVHLDDQTGEVHSHSLFMTMLTILN